MKIYKNKFKDLLIFKSQKFEDNRGYFRELCLEKLIKKEQELQSPIKYFEQLIDKYVSPEKFGGVEIEVHADAPEE